MLFAGRQLRLGPPAFAAWRWSTGWPRQCSSGSEAGAVEPSKRRAGCLVVNVVRCVWRNRDLLGVWNRGCSIKLEAECRGGAERPQKLLRTSSFIFRGRIVNGLIGALPGPGARGPWPVAREVALLGG